MDIPVSCKWCEYEWSYSGDRHPDSNPNEQISCPDCGKPTRFEDALRIPRSEVPEPSTNPFAEHIEAIHENTLFTRKQSEVLALKKAGYTTVEIARRMDISTGMVNQHEQNIEERLEQARKTLAFGDDNSVTLGTGHGPQRYVNIPLTPEMVINSS